MTARNLITALVVGGGSLLGAVRPSFATAGLAEWEITTPGGHLISHIDPLKTRHGICLRKPDETPGLIQEQTERILVSDMEWWIYYAGAVAGRGREGHFLLDERRETVELFATEEALVHAIAARHLGAPLSKRLTGADGWNEAWLPVYRERCRQLTAGAPELADLPPESRKRLERFCADLPKP